MLLVADANVTWIGKNYFTVCYFSYFIFYTFISSLSLFQSHKICLCNAISWSYLVHTTESNRESDMTLTFQQQTERYEKCVCIGLYITYIGVFVHKKIKYKIFTCHMTQFLSLFNFTMVQAVEIRPCGWRIAVYGTVDKVDIDYVKTLTPRIHQLRYWPNLSWQISSFSNTCVNIWPFWGMLVSDYCIPNLFNSNSCKSIH